jgi:hypothetical protein
MKDHLLKAIGIILLLFSVGVMGQVKTTSPLDITNPIQVSSDPVQVVEKGELYTNPCLSRNSCMFTLESICVYDGKGEYHCECRDGYTKSRTGKCLSYCHEDVNPCNSTDTCVEDLENKAICLDSASAQAWNSCTDKTSAACGGVLICKEEDLNGECKIVKNDMYTGLIGRTYKSVKAFNNWEAYFLNEDIFYQYTGFIKQNGVNYTQDEIINFVYPDDSDKNYIIPQYNTP